MIPVRNAGLRSAILVAALASSMAVTPTAFAGGKKQSFNDADVVIRGGNAVSVDVCVNWAQKFAGYSAEQKKRHEKKRIAQSNVCDNTAVAEGGSVDLNKVNITVDQAGKRRASKNSASVTITGGDAVALAACLNVLKGATDVEQTNKCENTAIATGGSVTLEKTDITIIQS